LISVRSEVQVFPGPPISGISDQMSGIKSSCFLIPDY
jgi:hypothetical protein